MKVSTLYDFPSRIKNKKISNLVYKINKVLLNIFYPILAKPIYGVDENSKIIISLTSFPARIDTVWMTIMTLLNQTQKPKAIVLWLAEEQFPNKEDDLPIKLLSLKEYGLTIKFCDNLYPHKKYFYTMKENPDFFVLTVDDDMFYPEYLVEQLYKTSLENKYAISCTWSHRITLNEDNHIEKYHNWQKCFSGGTSPDLFLMPVGCGGVLYPPKSLHEDLFDEEKIKKLCLYTDDLWLKCMAILNNRPSVRVSKPARTYMTILKTQKLGLYYTNLGENKNDVSLSRILQEYPDVERILVSVDEKN